jgi:hypothetical protein
VVLFDNGSDIKCFIIIAIDAKRFFWLLNILTRALDQFVDASLITLQISFMLRLVLALVVALTVTAEVCHDVVFASPDQWNVDPSLSFLFNMTLASNPVAFNSSFGVCNYYDSMPVCCNTDMLESIALAVNRSNEALASARKSVDNEETFRTIVSLLELLAPNTTIIDDIILLNNSILALRNAQLECVSALNAYTEGMMCLSCAVNASQFVEVATHTFLLSPDTCSGVVQHCTPVFDASRGILQSLMKIVTQLFSQDDAEFEALPDMCGGTEAHPGNCSEFMCDVWLNGVRIPSYSWGIEPTPNASQTFLQDSVSPRSIVHHIHEMIGASARRQVVALASASSNRYVANGYPALAVGCSSVDCNPSSSTPESSSHTVAIAVGCSVGGALVVLAVVGLLKRRRPSGTEDDHLMAQNKSYTAL